MAADVRAAFRGVADQPEHRGPEPDEQGAALGVAALFLRHGLGADPEADAEADGAQRRGVERDAQATEKLTHGTVLPAPRWVDTPT